MLEEYRVYRQRVKLANSNWCKWFFVNEIGINNQATLEELAQEIAKERTRSRKTDVPFRFVAPSSVSTGIITYEPSTGKTVQNEPLNENQQAQLMHYTLQCQDRN